MTSKRKLKHVVEMEEKEEIQVLKQKLLEKDAEIIRLKSILESEANSDFKPIKDIREDCVSSVLNSVHLDNDDIRRYSRQLILPEIGVQGQIRLKNSKILIVGAGGLGCPAAIYLSAAGVGRLGIVDYDEVEISNLHRQILHAESRVGLPKSQSAFITCHGLNSKVDFVPYHLALNSSNALALISKYDIVLDATDNVATRYLLNDACVLAGKPLVSGSALRFEGQLTVYNHNKGPCYRCLYPKPPPPETVTNCSDGGVLGVVPGIIGCLQALEAIKIASGIGTSFSERMLLFDGIDGVFRNIRLRGRQVNCPICGDNPTITKLIDYEQFCGAKATDKDKDISLLQENQRLSSKEYEKLLENKTPHILIDVRQPVELDICQLPNPKTINIPVSHLKKKEKMEEVKASIDQLYSTCDTTIPVIVVCRRGNDSQAAVNELKDMLSDKDNITIQDIRGGIHAWAKQVDPNFPVY